MCVILKFCTKQTHSSFIDLPYGMSVTLNTHGWTHLTEARKPGCFISHIGQDNDLKVAG